MKKLFFVIGILGSLGFTRVPEKLSNTAHFNERPFANRQSDAYLEVRCSEATVISY